MKTWIDIVGAAGFNVAQMEPIDVYLLGGRIIRDLRTVRSNRGTSSVTILNEMSEAQKKELRERVRK